MSDQEQPEPEDSTEAKLDVIIALLTELRDLAKAEWDKHGWA